MTDFYRTGIADALTEISKQLQRQNDLTEKLIQLKIHGLKLAESIGTGGRYPSGKQEWEPE